MPEGYVEIENVTDNFRTSIIYQDKQKNEIELKYFFFFFFVTIDNEHYVITSYDSDTKHFFLSQDENFPNILLWYDDTECYMLQVYLEKEELFKIEKNIK